MNIIENKNVLSNSRILIYNKIIFNKIKISLKISEYSIWQKLAHR